jgi:hypothetical protein
LRAIINPNTVRCYIILAIYIYKRSLFTRLGRIACSQQEYVLCFGYYLQYGTTPSPCHSHIYNMAHLLRLDIHIFIIWCISFVLTFTHYSYKSINILCITNRGKRGCSWLRHGPTIREVEVSISDSVIIILNHSGHRVFSFCVLGNLFSTKLILIHWYKIWDSKGAAK